MEKYRRDIDGLRALAIAPVVLFHAGAPLVTGGFAGVDIFFVISGFLITSNILGDVKADRFSILHFYERRFRRIIPALFCLLAVCSAAAVLLYQPADLEAYGERLIAAAAFVANINFYLTSNYFGPKADSLELLHLWSLAVEEQFYLFFPPFVWLIWRVFNGRFFATACALTALISFALSVIAGFNFQTAGFYLLPTRAWEMLIGSMLACNILPALSPRASSSIGLVGLLALACTFLLYSASIPFPGFAALLPCAGSAMIIYAGQHDRNNAAATLLSRPPVVFLGLISYSLYLWHWPMIVMPQYYLDRPLRPVEMVLAVSAAILLAILSWRFVERPFRRPSGGRGTYLKPVVAALTCLVGVGAVGTTFAASNGLPARVSSPVRSAQLATAESTHEFGCALSVGGEAKDPCGPSVSVFLWGDSHALHYLPAIQAIYGAKNVGRLSGPGCPPIPGVLPISFLPEITKFVEPHDDGAAERCRKTNDAALAALVDRPGVKVVFLGGAWSFFSEGIELGSGEARQLLRTRAEQGSVPHTRELLEEALRSTVATLTSRGIHVVLLGDVPQSDRSPSACLGKAAMYGRSPTLCEIQKVPALQRLAFSNDLLRDLAHAEDVSAFIPSDILCRHRTCAVKRGEVYTYKDFDHLTPSAARLLAPDIKAALSMQQRDDRVTKADLGIARKDMSKAGG